MTLFELRHVSDVLSVLYDTNYASKNWVNSLSFFAANGACESGGGVHALITSATMSSHLGTYCKMNSCEVILFNPCEGCK